MQEKCPFGPLFATHRKRRDMSLWQFCLAMRYQPRNVQRIESGSQEPRLGLALRMLAVLGVDVGAFFAELAAKPPKVDGDSTRRLVLQSAHVLSENQSVAQRFGALFLAARRQNGFSQQHIAETTGFHLRNMTKIENGLQEPRVMTALRLVEATGCDVGQLFSVLAENTPATDNAPMQG